MYTPKPEQQETVYKVVVLEDDGTLISPCALGKYQLIYTPEKEIKHTGIFVFESLYYARIFRLSNGYQIWRAKTFSVRPAPERILSGLAPDNQYTIFWKLGSARVQSKYLVTPFLGSLVCDALTLIEQVV